MKHHIFIIEEDKAYLEKLAAYLEKNYENEAEIWSSTKVSEANYQQMNTADVLLIQEEQFHQLEKGLQNKAVVLSTNASIETLGGQPSIKKFQRPDVIYQELKQYCNQWLKQEQTQAKKQPSIEVGMLVNNQIDGLIPVVQKQDGELLYQTQGLINWKEFLQQKPSQRQLLEIVAKMIQTMCGLEDYMLEPNQIVFEEERVYIDPKTLEPFLCYIPSEIEKHAFWGGLKGLGMLLVRDELYDVVQEPKSQNLEEPLEEIQGFAQTTLFEPEESVEEYGETEVFWESQEKARQSKERREDAKRKGISIRDIQLTKACLKRCKTGEKISIDTNIFKLGKEKDYVNYCILDNPAISRSHADIVRQGDQFFVVDQNSLNHTFVNGVEIAAKQMVALQTGTEIRLADERFEFTIS